MPDVQVTNRNQFSLAGKFDGTGYVFRPDVPTSVPEKAARHIFGLGAPLPFKTGAYNRLGLLKPGDTMETAQRVIDNVEFVMGRTVFETPEPMPQPQEPPKPDPDRENGDEDEEIGGNPGAQPGPGRETEAGAQPVSAAGALAREVMRGRRANKIPLGG